MAAEAQGDTVKYMLLIPAVLLTGCGSNPVVREVKVAVPVACQIAEPERPSMPTEDLDPEAPVDVQARHMRAEIELREGYEDKLVTALRGCRSPIKP